MNKMSYSGCNRCKRDHVDIYLPDENGDMHCLKCTIILEVEKKFAIFIKQYRKDQIYRKKNLK